jgi:hypothetical protein
VPEADLQRRALLGIRCLRYCIMYVKEQANMDATTELGCNSGPAKVEHRPE